ncbi:hypothetical protein PIB30_014952 [Stylosanthes scabra]|uniref:Uncharacterized protein n=1 Tax=Stylosanthes scabra TaxID=79078 RepID=A0ABU6W7N1_9FABA|nr:hypothetical protein [Stylosanthes scabra]
MQGVSTAITDGQRDTARTDGLAVGIGITEPAAGAVGGWGSSVFVQFRRCPYISQQLRLGRRDPSGLFTVEIVCVCSVFVVGNKEKTVCRNYGALSYTIHGCMIEFMQIGEA